ncbi:MAG: Unknown protein [uncultured Thiotrichaceae bacterium]|uniref:Type 4 fimbrial biogenesis protein PilX N-terminal domain-containing protein n=1 Tax=uncultured Thiotrichaceae bacterium TaxID=298394 RepID=A0A6S6S172_9GAMM|nr:MAG: Unknown protein [uncultured Thiotrichaceae bacterium]
MSEASVKSLSFHQSGATLLWALGVLLVMSIVTISASRSSSLSVRIAHNGVLQKSAYQGAESALTKTLERSKMLITSDTGTANTDGNKVKTFSATSLGNLSLQGSIEALGASDCPQLSTVAMSTELSRDSGGVTCAAYRVTGGAVVNGTAVRDSHVVGVKIFIPSKEVVEFK